MPTISGARSSTSAHPNSLAEAPSLDAVAQGSAVLRRGMSGDGVRALQRLLRERGQILAADGRYGPLTEAVVREFQEGAGLDPSGVVDRETLARLTAERPPDGTA